MSRTTLHQARTIIPHMEEQHLLVETMFQSDRAALRLFNNKPDGRRESEATIYLSAEQWGELAAIAAVMAKVTTAPSENSTYLNNEQVNAWQDANIAAALEKKILETLESFAGTDDWSMAYGVDDEVMDALVERKLVEFKAGNFPSGRPKPMYRITPLGRTAATKEGI